MTDKFLTQKLIDIATRFSIFLALISMFAMMILITVDAILNKVINHPIPGTIELTTYYFMVLCVFLALPYVEKCQTHISADFIVAHLSPKTRSAFDIVGKLFTLVFYSLLAYGAVTKAIQSTQRLETVMSNFTFYIWPTRWGVAIGILSAIFVILMILMQRWKNRN